jgi:hypothetical protein
MDLSVERKIIPIQGLATVHAWDGKAWGNQCHPMKQSEEENQDPTVSPQPGEPKGISHRIECPELLVGEEGSWVRGLGPRTGCWI